MSLAPQLATRADVAAYLKRPNRDVSYLAYKVLDSEKYRRFTIPKKAGGVRDIVSPKRPLSDIQGSLCELLNGLYRPRSCVHGFVAERGIVTNAAEHAGRSFILNIDLKDFFPHIHFGRVRGILQAYGLGDRAAELIARLCCYEGQLPQGAPTSPVLSNMVCSKMDNELARFARTRRLRYTRYADDMTFSSHAPFGEDVVTGSGGIARVGPRLLDIVEANGFHVNPTKVRVQRKNVRQSVTGLTVNSFPNVERRMVRRVRAILHAMQKYGIKAAQDEHIAKFRKKGKLKGDVDIVEVVQGSLGFIRGVREHTISLGDDTVLLGLLRKAKKYDRRLERKFGDVLAAQAASLDHNEALRMAELTLRNVVQQRLIFAYGDKWKEEVESVVGAVDYRKAVERQKEKGPGAHDVLSYLYINDLQNLITKNWRVMAEAFYVNERRLNKTISPLRGLRTDHAHHNSTLAESEALRMAAHDVIKQTRPEYRCD